MRRVFVALAALGLSGLTGPGATDAEAGLCRIYCEVMTVSCRATFGQLDEDYCEEWREGCLAGCQVEKKE